MFGMVLASQLCDDELLKNGVQVFDIENVVEVSHYEEGILKTYRPWYLSNYQYWCR